MSDLFDGLMDRLDAAADHAIEQNAALRADNETLRALLREALEGMEHIPAEPSSWIGRVRAALARRAE